MDNKPETEEAADQAAGQATTAPAVDASNKDNAANGGELNDTGNTATVPGNKSAGRGWRWLTLLLLVLILVGLAAGGWHGYQFQQRLQQAGLKNAEALTRMEALDEQLALERAERVKLEGQLLADISDTREALQAQAREIASLSALDREQWLLAELEYLVRLANQRLLTENRPQGALALLIAADELLGSLDSVETLAVREVLAKDISALKMEKVVDREGIYARLGALSSAMLALPAVPSTSLRELTGGESVVKPATDERRAGEEANMAWYEHLWNNAKETLSGFVRNHFHVRYRDIPVEPLVSGQQEQWLRHDLAINLSNAQQALLRGEQGIYDTSLAVVAGHLRQYFKGAARTPTLLEEITSLQRESVVQSLPDITASSEALKQLRARKTAAAPTGRHP